MQHTLFVKVKKIFRPKNTILSENYNPNPLDIFNGLSQAYYIKPERKNKQYTKGLYQQKNGLYSVDILCIYLYPLKRHL